MPPKRKAAVNTPNVKASSKKKYGMASVISAGAVLTDFSKKQWLLGRSFASGGFGRIYFARKMDEKNEDYVIKMEPADNGPLYQESHMYSRFGKSRLLQEFKEKHRLSFLGIPEFYGTGLYVDRDVTLRFLIMPRLGSDVEKIRETQSNGKFSNPSDVIRLAITCLECLHYLHTQNIVHADLKGENLLLSADCKPEPKNLHKTYLVDYGLARKLRDAPLYKEDPKKAHDGTLVFTSLDAHKGCAPSYRGDVEILAYNIVFWICGSLSWFDKSPDAVFKEKSAFSSSVKPYLNRNLVVENKLHGLVDDLTKFFEICYSTSYELRPDYEKLRRILRDLLTKAEKVTVAAKISTKSRQGLDSDSENDANFSNKKSTRSASIKKPKTNLAVRQNQTPCNSKYSPIKASLNLNPPTNTSSEDIFEALGRAPHGSKNSLKKSTKSIPIVRRNDESEDGSCSKQPTGQVTFKEPLRPAIAKSSIPGLANLKNDNKSEMKIPGVAFRRRQSVEASLLKKYNRLLCTASTNKTKPVLKQRYKSHFPEETTDASTTSCNEDEPSFAQKSSNVKSVGVNTSPNTVDGWISTRAVRRCRV